MKRIIKVEKEVEIKTLKVRAGVRYWEDATVSGIRDENGDLIPCRDGDNWCPLIDVDTGQITNWTKGVTAEIHYKVCDDGDYYLLDEKDEVLSHKNGYVPDIMCPKEVGYGDYIIMDIDENGFVKDWKFDDDEFLTDDDE